jgi:hypothetical protein
MGVARPLVALLLVVVVGCGTTDLTGRPDASHDPTVEDLTSEDVPSEDTTEIEPTCWDRDDDGYLDEACGGDDCDDSNPDIYPGAPEVCLDGVDQDCDMVIDAFTAATDEIMLSPEGHSCWNPVLVWTGSEFGVAWWDAGAPDVDLRNEVYLARVSETGEPAGEPVRMNDDADDVEYFFSKLSLAWTGSEFGVAWTTERHVPGEDPALSYKVEFARAGPDGAKRGEDVLLRADATYPSLAWTGSVYGLAWSHVPADLTYDPEIYFNQFDTEGSALGEDIQVTTDTALGNYWPVLMWTGSEFGLIWKQVAHWYYHGYDYFFNRIAPDGSVLLDDSLIDTTRDFGGYPSLAWSGSMFAGGWRGNFVLIDPSGFPASDPLEIPGEGMRDYSSLIYGPSAIAWTGSKYGLVVEGAYPNDEIFFHWVSADGSEQSRVIQLSSEEPLPSGGDAGSGLAWTGSVFGVVWKSEEDGGIHYRVVGFCE